jgi:hypothetical protein
MALFVLEAQFAEQLEMTPQAARMMGQVNSDVAPTTGRPTACTRCPTSRRYVKRHGVSPSGPT